MTVTYLKKGIKTSKQEQRELLKIVKDILDEIENGGEEALREIAKKFDNWSGNIEVSNVFIDDAEKSLDNNVKKDIKYAVQNIKKFAQKQLESVSSFETELRPGLIAGQKLIPVNTVGCYVPGGRYCHIASAMMTVTTAKVAGVKSIIACTPPSLNSKAPVKPELLYTLRLCGADRVFAIGGVQAIALMVNGLLSSPPADVIAGPGNEFVAEAKRQVFGSVGIDMVAGPTNSLIIADKKADSKLIAWDLISQAEHGHNSPVWLITESESLAKQVIEIIPQILGELPEQNRDNAKKAWDNCGEVVLCSEKEEILNLANQIAPEHLHVQCLDLEYWFSNLESYGSLFLGEETTVSFGDKASGPNHVLPTSGAARYTGGLSVHKFLKTVTWQKLKREAVNDLAGVTARISRLEGMEAHAKAADIRINRFKKKYS